MEQGACGRGPFRAQGAGCGEGSRMDWAIGRCAMIRGSDHSLLPHLYGVLHNKVSYLLDRLVCATTFASWEANQSEAVESAAWDPTADGLPPRCYFA